MFCRRQHREFIDHYFENKVKSYKRWLEQRLNKENKDEEKRIEHVKRVNEVRTVPECVYLCARGLVCPTRFRWCCCFLMVPSVSPQLLLLLLCVIPTHLRAFYGFL